MTHSVWMFLPSPLQRRTLLRFGAAMAIGNLVWEMAHMPLYTVWQTGTRSESAYAEMHCALGDILIATACLGGAVSLLGRHGWPGRGYAKVAATTILVAICYTIFSEWLNVESRGTWAYRDFMPRLPILGTGLTPVLQSLVVPSVAFWWAKRGIAGESS